MAGVDFFQAPPDPSADQAGFSRAQDMARLLQRQGMAPQQGQMVNGNYVAPSPVAYASQLASGLAGGYQQNQLNESRRASNILNAVEPAQPGRFQRSGTLFSGFGGGGGT